MSAQQVPTRTERRNTRVALSIVAVACVMLGLSFAAVPLYQLFCRATGYGGTTQVATDSPQTLGSRTLTVRFDTNIASDLPWTFVPEETSLRQPAAGLTKSPASALTSLLFRPAKRLNYPLSFFSIQPWSAKQQWRVWRV